ncbi:PD-(D/E)XK nuclease family protein [archaeon]|nr:PD-(D/E)XK nuclease family protein [archaeon]
MYSMPSEVKYKLSPSSLNLLEECPRCFWLYVTQKRSRPSGAFPSLPSGVDRILKHHFDKYRELGELPPELHKHGVAGKLFSDMDLLKVWRNNLKGLQFIDKENKIMLRGAVDDLLQNDEKIIALDFKTRGFALKEDTHHHYQHQLNLYNFLLRKNGYDTEDYAYLLFFMPEAINETGHFVFHTDLVKMKINVEHAEQLFHKAIKVVEGEIPDSSDECKFCKWQKL